MAYEDLMLAPVPIALFFLQGGRRQKTIKLSKIAATIPMVVWIINNGMHFLGIMNLAVSLKITQIMILIELIFISWIQMSEQIYIGKQKDEYNGIFWRVPLVGIGILVPLGIIEVLKYTFVDTKYPNDGILITLGIMFYILSLAADSAIRMGHRTMQWRQESEEKSQFLANMSHEIRTPLNVILGFDEMILRETTQKRVSEYAASIQKAGDALKQIINSILDLTKIEAGKMEIYSVEYSTVQLLDNVISMTETLARDKGIKLYLDIDGNLPEVMIGDENHIRQVLTNLTTNAVKYTKEGSITFTAKLIEFEESSPLCKIYFSIKDTGLGIREEDKERLFAKFERLDREKNYSTEGTGLGMSIVVSVLKAMDSKIEVDSTYGVGSDFHFVLSQCVVSDKRLESFEERRKERQFTQSGNDGFTAPEARILIVDDMEMNLNVTCALLERQKMQIDTAKSGFEAIELVQKNVYDVILMDHMMPKMDGIEATQEIRNLAETTENPYYAMVPIIALTANVMAGMKNSFIQCGMQDFISKPVEAKTLITEIKKWLPKEKIYEEVQENHTPDADVSDEWNVVIPTIDIDTARKYNLDYAMFEANLKAFYKGIHDTKTKIMNFRKNGDAENYIITVHGLKSTAKIIGAMDLSEKARELEEGATNQEFPKVWEETEQLLTLYEEDEKALAEFLEKKKEPNVEETILDDKDYEKLCGRIKAAADAFDMETFMQLEEELEHISVMPQHEAELELLREHIRNLAFGDVSELLDTR